MCAAISLLAISCGGATTAPTASKKVAAPPKPIASSERQPTKVPPPKVVHVDDVVATLYVRDYNALSEGLLAYVMPHLPAPYAGVLNPDQLWAQLAAAIPSAQPFLAAVDRSRSWAMAAIVPADGPPARKPVVVAVPVADDVLLVGALAKLVGAKQESRGEEFVFTNAGGQLWLRLTQGHAYVASTQDLLHQGVKALRPMVHAKKDTAIKLSMDLEKFRSRVKSLGKNFDKLVESMSGDAWFDKLKDTIKISNRFEAKLELPKSGIDGTLTLTGQYSEKATRPWGLNLLPEDSSIVTYSSASTPVNAAELRENISQALKAAKIDGTSTKTAPFIDDLSKLSAKLSQLTSGPQAGALWISPEGGVLFGGPFQINDAVESRRALTELMNTVGKAISKEVKRKDNWLTKLRGFSLKYKLRGNAFRLPNTKGDVAELRFTWPRVTKKNAAAMKLSKVELKASLTRWRKAIGTFIGSKLKVAWAFTEIGGQKIGYLLAGKDADKWLPKMLAKANANAKGESGGLPQSIAQRIGSKPVGKLFYADLTSLLSAGMRTALVLDLPPKFAPIVAALQPLARDQRPAPMLTWYEPEQERMTFRVHISAIALGKVAKGTIAAIIGSKAPRQVP